MDNDVDEENGEEVEKVIFQIVEVLEGNYEYDEDVNQIHVAFQRLKELIGEPIDDTKHYEAVLSNDYDSERDINDLFIHRIKAI